MANASVTWVSYILSVYPKVLYTYCTSYILNLCVVKSLDLRIVKNTMGLADSIARFFKNSPKRQVALEMIWVGMTIQTVPNWKKCVGHNG